MADFTVLECRDGYLVIPSHYKAWRWASSPKPLARRFAWNAVRWEADSFRVCPSLLATIVEDITKAGFTYERRQLA